MTGPKNILVPLAPSARFAVAKGALDDLAPQPLPSSPLRPAALPSCRQNEYRPTVRGRYDPASQSTVAPMRRLRPKTGLGHEPARTLRNGLHHVAQGVEPMVFGLRLDVFSR